MISPELSFRDVLVNYSNEQVIEEIEDKVSRLTVFVPDWSWIDPDAFSVQKWDTTQPEVVTSYYVRGDEKVIFKNGSLLGILGSDDFLNTPILIVKDNDKMIVRESRTKALQKEYEFSNDAFNGVLDTKGHGVVHEEFDLGIYNETEEEELSALTGRVSGAYNESMKNYRLCQRDYVYYNMTSSVDTGWVDFHYKERVTKIRLNVYAGGLFYNSEIGNETGDYVFIHKEINPTATPGVNINRTWLTIEQIKKMAWGNGTITLSAHIAYGSSAVTKVISIPFDQAFHVDKVEQVREENWLGATMWRDYFTKQEYLTSKWIPVNWDLFCWDLSQMPLKYIVSFEEYDSKTTRQEAGSSEFEYATNFKTNNETSVSGKIDEVQVGMKMGYEAGTSVREKRTQSYSYSTVDESDDLGGFEVEFKDPFVSSITGNKARYYIYSTGSVDAVVRPAKIY